MLSYKTIRTEKDFILRKDSFDFLLIKNPTEQTEELFSSKLINIVQKILTDVLYHETYFVSSPTEISIAKHQELFVHLNSFSSNHLQQDFRFSYIKNEKNITQGFILQHINDKELLIIIPKNSKELFNLLIHTSSTNKMTIVSDEDLSNHFYFPTIDCSVHDFVGRRTTENVSLGFNKHDVSFLRRKTFHLIPLSEDCLTEMDGTLYSQSHYFDKHFTLEQMNQFEEMAHLYLHFFKNHFNFSEEQISYFLKKDVLVLCFEPNYSSNSEVHLNDIVDTIQRCLRFDEKSLQIHESNDCVTLIFNRLFSNSSFEYVHCFINLNEDKMIADIHFLFPRFNEREIDQFFDQFINKKLNLEVLNHVN